MICTPPRVCLSKSKFNSLHSQCLVLLLPRYVVQWSCRTAFKSQSAAASLPPTTDYYVMCKLWVIIILKLAKYYRHNLRYTQSPVHPPIRWPILSLFGLLMSELRFKFRPFDCAEETRWLVNDYKKRAAITHIYLYGRGRRRRRDEMRVFRNPPPPPSHHRNIATRKSR